MKHELSETSPTRKQLTFDVPADIVEQEVARVAANYSKSAKVPGFRQGKVPAKVVRQRYMEQILDDVAHQLIPRLVTDALIEHQLQPVAAPDIHDLHLKEGEPMTFHAHFEVLPAIRVEQPSELDTGLRVDGLSVPLELVGGQAT